ncbi:MAG: AAA family ATPase [Pseudomonadota bacterium]
MYTDHYGFSGKPFALTPDLRFFYPSAGHQRAMSYLRYGLEQGEGFVVITGHIGTGKTLLIQTLLSDLADQNIAFARIATANLSAERVPAVVASALGLPFEGKSKESLLRTLERALVKAHKTLEHVLLIVDEAQTLKADVLEELRILSNLEVQGKALLQVFLIGQTELQLSLRKRNMGQLRQRIVASYHLQPLSAEDTRQYIEFRLNACDWDGLPQISDATYERIHESTQGVPRKINILMDRILLFGSLEDVDAFEVSHVDTVMGELQVELAGDLADIEEEETDEPDATLEDSGGEGRRPTRLESRLRALEQKLEKLSASNE